MRALIIINPAAGANRALARWAPFEARFKKSGLQAEQILTNGPEDASCLAKKAAGEYDLLIVGGGDGTVAEVVGGILGSDSNRAALGILPLGTGNDLAETLGIRTLIQAIHTVSAHHAKPIDVLQVHCQNNGHPVVRYAMLFAGVGIISDALKKTTPGLKRRLGQRLAYPAGLVRALFSYRSPQMEVKSDHTNTTQGFLFAGASNTPIAGGGMKIAPDAKIDDGLLNVNLVSAVGRCQALLLLRLLCRGRHTNHPKINYHVARSLEISAPEGLEVAADGELIGQTPVRVIILPKALRVLVPQCL